MKIVASLSLLIIFSFASAAGNFNQAVSTAESGDNDAQMIVGLAYYFGEYGKLREPVEKDIQKSIYWMSLSSDGGNCFSSWFLGGIYNEGKFVEKDESLAVKYLLLAAERGNIKAQRNMAIKYYKGTGVPQNYDIAYAWVSLANFLEPGNKNSQALLDAIIPKLENRQKSDDFAGNYVYKYTEPQSDCGNT